MQRTLALFLAIIGSAAMTILLEGCSTAPPTKEEREAVNYGPKPDNIEQIVRDYLRYRLNDPTAAIIEFKAGPTQLYQKDTVIRDLQFGWAVCAMINDKNSRGAYDGFTPGVYFIRNGKVIARNGGPDDGPIGAKYARDQCKELGYAVP
jgi:hypothetical protein